VGVWVGAQDGLLLGWHDIVNCRAESVGLVEKVVLWLKGMVCVLGDNVNPEVDVRVRGLDKVLLPVKLKESLPANASLLVSVRDKDNAIDMEALMGTWLSVAVGVPVGVGVGHAFRQTGMPWHSISPGRHSHIALTHWRVSSQALPQMPQFFWWVCRSTH
jgi:hypothetical protein